MKDHEIQRAFHPVPTLLEETGPDRNGEANGFVPAVPDTEVAKLLPSELVREGIENFPRLGETEIIRHFTRLSQLNFGIDGGLYPLGSCTMKYNPKVNEQIAAFEGFAQLHPLTPVKWAQGALEVMYRLQQALTQITGMKGCSLHPAAGAHGELVGVKMIGAYHKRRGDKTRTTIIIPDSAHGTNPASATLSGMTVKQVASCERGMLDVADLEKVLDDTVAGIMITVPNTLGIFEENIVEIARAVHDRGGLVYCDGANLNALVGQVDVAKMGVDVMHINLHKTFSTPHGGGGPGAGPVVVSEKLIDFLPFPVVRERDGVYWLDDKVPHTVGKFRAFYGNFGILVRALAYIYAFGKEHLSEISENAVLNANYLKARLRESYHLPYETPTMHEAVFSDKWQEKETHVTTLDIAKRLMDYGFHPPTIYFPLVVHGALMIEPTETESKHELDRFVDAMVQIAREAKSSPERVKGAPHNLGIKRIDEVKAARNLTLTWNPPK
ncbi:MAG: aminomethyl-transferring glycine dehydrogenase subunit GcvPB [Pseudomonadota bacterium]